MHENSMPRERKGNTEGAVPIGDCIRSALKELGINQPAHINSQQVHHQHARHWLDVKSPPSILSYARNVGLETGALAVTVRFAFVGDRLPEFMILDDSGARMFCAPSWLYRVWQDRHSPLPDYDMKKHQDCLATLESVMGDAHRVVCIMIGSHPHAPRNVTLDMLLSFKTAYGPPVAVPASYSTNDIYSWQSPAKMTLRLDMEQTL